jgi:hypothetical protein
VRRFSRFFSNKNIEIGNLYEKDNKGKETIKTLATFIAVFNER